MRPFPIVIVINQASVNFPAIGPGHYNSSKQEFPSVEWGIKSNKKAGGYSLNLCATIGDYFGSLVYMHSLVDHSPFER